VVEAVQIRGLPLERVVLVVEVMVVYSLLTEAAEHLQLVVAVVVVVTPEVVAALALLSLKYLTT
jgi:hypothetical protein